MLSTLGRRVRSAFSLDRAKIAKKIYLVAWIEFKTASTSVSQELPQITYSSSSRAMGDGKWGDGSWITALLESKQLKNIQLNIAKAGTSK